MLPLSFIPVLTYAWVPAFRYELKKEFGLKTFEPHQINGKTFGLLMCLKKVLPNGPASETKLATAAISPPSPPYKYLR